MPPSRVRSQPLEYNILLTATLCLVAGGAIMVYSASSAQTVLQSQGDGTSFLVRYLMYGGIGLIAMNILARRGLDLVVRFTNPLLAISFFLLVCVKVPGIGVTVNGARRWIGAGPLQFQPAELMKLALVLYTVKLLATRPKIVRELRTLVPLGMVAGSACLLIASQPDLGTALVIAFTLTALLVVAGIPMRHLAIAVGVGAFVVLLFALIEPYRRARLTAFLNPWADATDSGFQSVQGQIAIGSGGLFGRGLGESVQKAFFLPEAHTDFILAIIGEEIGVVGVSAVLFLYGLVAYAGLRVAKAARGSYGKLLAAGITSMIVCQGMLNVFAVLGLAPLTGVPLPFVSYGSTNLMVLLASMGLLLNIAGGGVAHVRAVPDRGKRGSRLDDQRPHRSGRDSGARGARAGGGRRATG
jgi:cell division protein FtsW